MPDSFPPSSSSSLLSLDSARYNLAPPPPSRLRPPQSTFASHPLCTSSTSSHLTASTSFNAASFSRPFSSFPRPLHQSRRLLPVSTSFTVPSPVSTMPPPLLSHSAPASLTSTAFTARHSQLSRPSLLLHCPPPSSTSYQPPSSPSVLPLITRPLYSLRPPHPQPLLTTARGTTGLELEEQRNNNASTRARGDHRMMNTAALISSQPASAGGPARLPARRTRELHQVEEQKANAFYSYGL